MCLVWDSAAYRPALHEVEGANLNLPGIGVHLHDVGDARCLDRLCSPGSCQIISSNNCLLSEESSSWISVAWYPIYRIQMGPTLQNLDACFSAHHSLSLQPHQVPASTWMGSPSGALMSGNFMVSGFLFPTIHTGGEPKHQHSLPLILKRKSPFPNI
ncbi:hypothetical protein GQ457_14G016440 [Hibiscus cannabinus]